LPCGRACGATLDLLACFFLLFVVQGRVFWRSVFRRGGPLRRAPTVTAGQVRALCHCSVAHPPSPSHSCTFLLQARVVGAVHDVQGGLLRRAPARGGGAGTWWFPCRTLDEWPLCCSLHHRFHSCLPAALQDRAPGAVYDVQTGALSTEGPTVAALQVRSSSGHVVADGPRGGRRRWPRGHKIHPSACLLRRALVTRHPRSCLI